MLLFFIARWWFSTQYKQLNFERNVDTPMQYTAIFHGCKNGNFQMKNCGIFLNFAQNIDCAPTRCFRAKIRKLYTPVNPNFTIKKWGVRGY